MGATLRVVFDHIPDLQRFLKSGDVIADAVATAVVDEARPHVPVDTSSAQRSLHVVSALTDDTKAAEDAAREVNPPVEITEPVERPATNSGRAYIASTVGHMWVLEMGSVSQAPRPAVIPAVETVLENQAKDLIGKAVLKAVPGGK